MMNESKSWSQILDIVREKKVAAYQYWKNKLIDPFVCDLIALWISEP